jgi:putative glutamine amidotransferase
VRPKIAIPEPCSYDREYSDRALFPYLRAVEDAGGEAVIIPLNLPPAEIARRINECAAVLLPGSKADVDPQKYGAERHPQTAQADSLRDTADELLLQDAYNMRKPILGICYGLQSLNVWRTGTLVQHIESQINHSPKDKTAMAHEIAIEPGSLLASEIAASREKPMIEVNSSHHQAAEVVGDGLRAVARSSADGVVEALEGTLPGHYVLAVQWHPERSVDRDEWSRNLFRNFVSAARHWHAPSQHE